MKTPSPSRPRPRRAQRGISMLEVLVAFVVLSFGMLGLAGLQLRTMAYSQSSLFRSQASALTDDVLDRMRADRTNARLASGGWNTAMTDTTGVTPADLADWKTEVASLLPDGHASIAVDANGVVTIVVRWVDSPDKQSTEEFTTLSRL